MRARPRQAADAEVAPQGGGARAEPVAHGDGHARDQALQPGGPGQERGDQRGGEEPRRGGDADAGQHAVERPLRAPERGHQRAVPHALRGGLDERGGHDAPCLVRMVPSNRVGVGRVGAHRRFADGAGRSGSASGVSRMPWRTYGGRVPVGEGAGARRVGVRRAAVAPSGRSCAGLHDRIRNVLDDALDGVDPVAGAAALGDDLALRCRAVCTTLGAHHRDEDAALFPWLRREHPGLASVVDRLEQDHAMIGSLLAEPRRRGACWRGVARSCAGTSRGSTRSWRATSATRSVSSYRCSTGSSVTARPCRTASGAVGERVTPGGGRVSDVSEQVVVTRNEGESQWEARIGGELAGFAAYQLTDELVVFTHTEVDPAFEGKGVGGALARHALDEVADAGDSQGHAVVPLHQGVDRTAPRLQTARVRLRGGLTSGRPFKGFRKVGSWTVLAHISERQPAMRHDDLSTVRPRRGLAGWRGPSPSRRPASQCRSGSRGECRAGVFGGSTRCAHQLVTIAGTRGDGRTVRPE